MKSKKGMTLVEVMIAMVMLAIVMIGGVSFFTNAFRVNFTYIDFSNRLDHALRYVERLKVQKRDYPTYGAFLNVGSNPPTYTIFYVDSEQKDVASEYPYFYEHYSTIDGIEVVGYINPMPAPATESETATKKVYTTNFKQLKNNKDGNVNKNIIGDLDSNLTKTLLHNATDASGKYKDPIGTFDFNGISYNVYLTRNSSGEPKGKYSFSYDALVLFLKQTNETPTTPSFFPSTSKSYIEYYYQFDRITIQTTTSGGGYSVPPVDYVPEKLESPAKWGYSEITSGKWTISGSLSSEDDTVGWNEGGGANVVETFNSNANPVRRFYSSKPTAATYQNSNHHDSGSPALSTFAKEYNFAAKIGDTEPPYNNSLFVATYKVSDEPYSGGVKLDRLYEWKQQKAYQPYVPEVPYVPGVASTAPLTTTCRATTSTVTNQSSHVVRIEAVSGSASAVNSTRVTRYRKSVYISVYPVQAESQAKANDIVKGFMNANRDANDKVDSAKVIKAMEDYADSKSCNVIKIPFFNLYASNESSTLCEDILN